MGDALRLRRVLTSTAATAVLALGAAACSSGSSSSASLPTATTGAAVGSATTLPAAPAVPVTTVATPADPSASATTVAPPAVDGAALLHGAIAAMAAGYHFTTTLTVDGVVALTADGDRVGDGTRLGVTQGDVSVQYVITPTATWVQPEGGEWQQLDAESASTDPIAALAAPSVVQVTGVTGTATTVDASVPAAALGLGGADTVTMSATIDNGAITSVGYTTTIDGKPAVMQATIGAVVDPSPVVAPA